MGRPYGIGLYGRHRYGTGNFVYPTGVGEAGVQWGVSRPEVERGVSLAGSAASEAYSVPEVVNEYLVVGGSVSTALTTPVILRGARPDGGIRTTSGQASVVKSILAASAASARSSGTAMRPLAWVEQEGEGAWTRQGVQIRSWSIQSEAPPRPYGMARYGAGRYGRNPSPVVDEWEVVRYVR